VPLERHDNDSRWAYSLPWVARSITIERTIVLDKGKVTSVICRFHKPENN